LAELRDVDDALEQRARDRSRQESVGRAGVVEERAQGALVDGTGLLAGHQLIEIGVRGRGAQRSLLRVGLGGRLTEHGATLSLRAPEAEPRFRTETV